MKPFSSDRIRASFFCSFFGVSLAGCAGGRPADSAELTGAPAPPASPSSVERETDSSAAAEEEARVETKPEVQAEPAADAEESEAESNYDFDDGSKGGTEPAPSKGGTPKEKKRSLVSELHTALLQFEESLLPKVLSCEAALPHQKAICSIAERICQMEAPSTTRSGDCKQAQQSCENAKKRYQEKCE